MFDSTEDGDVWSITDMHSIVHGRAPRLVPVQQKVGAIVRKVLGASYLNWRSSGYKFVSVSCLYTFKEVNNVHTRGTRDKEYM